MDFCPQRRLRPSGNRFRSRSAESPVEHASQHKDRPVALLAKTLRDWPEMFETD